MSESSNLSQPGGDAAVVGLGLGGLGTVAQGVLDVLSKNAGLIGPRVGRRIEVRRVASRRPRPEANIGEAAFSTNVDDLIADPNVDVVVELIGGVDTALSLVRGALEAGKSVVTANKALLALHGNELVELARRQDVALCFEAAVAGGIPIIGAINRSLAGNQIESLAGIINGTGNFILTAMANDGASFVDALAEAQALGYAEADPTFDVEGIDAAHKLTILVALAFGTGYRFEEVYTEGISSVTPEDIEYARQLGYRLKHLGIARLRSDGIEARVHPALVPQGQLLANIEGVMNAVFVNSNAAGDTLYYGAGAGALPTASAVVGDIMDVAVGGGRALSDVGGHRLDLLPIERARCGYYLKIPALDVPGVFARIATILSDHGISIEAVIQQEQAVHQEVNEPWVPIVILTHSVVEEVMNRALIEVQALDAVVEDITRIRVETLHDG